jgi:hypothetical protein
MKPGETRQLQVNAHYPDGRKRDVTWLAQFFSNDAATADVTEAGLVTGKRPGETSIRAHFQGIVAVVTVTMPFSHDVDPKLYERTNNAVDVHVLAKLKDLRIPPSPDADDATFVRRAFLDAIGLPPTPEEVTSFLADKSPSISATCCRTARSATTTSAGPRACGRCTRGSAASSSPTARGTRSPATCSR